MLVQIGSASTDRPTRSCCDDQLNPPGGPWSADSLADVDFAFSATARCATKTHYCLCLAPSCARSSWACAPPAGPTRSVGTMPCAQNRTATLAASCRLCSNSETARGDHPVSCLTCSLLCRHALIQYTARKGHVPTGGYVDAAQQAVAPAVMAGAGGISAATILHWPANAAEFSYKIGSSAPMEHPAMAHSTRRRRQDQGGKQRAAGHHHLSEQRARRRHRDDLAGDLRRAGNV